MAWLFMVTLLERETPSMIAAEMKAESGRRALAHEPGAWRRGRDEAVLRDRRRRPALGARRLRLDRVLVALDVSRRLVAGARGGARGALDDAGGGRLTKGRRAGQPEGGEAKGDQAQR